MPDDTHELEDFLRPFLLPEKRAYSSHGIVTRFRSAANIVDHMTEEWKRLRQMDYASLVTLHDRLQARHRSFHTLLQDASPEKRDWILERHDVALRIAFATRIIVLAVLIRHVEGVGPKVPEVPPFSAVEEMKEHVTNEARVAEAIAATPGIADYLPKTPSVAARVLHLMCEMMDRFGYDSDPARDWQPVTAEVKDDLAQTLRRSVSQINDDLTCARKVASEMTSEARKRIGRTPPDKPM
jgi:hypothetical protein